MYDKTVFLLLSYMHFCILAKWSINIMTHSFTIHIRSEILTFLGTLYNCAIRKWIDFMFVFRLMLQIVISHFTSMAELNRVCVGFFLSLSQNSLWYPCNSSKYVQWCFHYCFSIGKYWYNIVPAERLPELPFSRTRLFFANQSNC